MDENAQASVKTLLQQWVKDRQQELLEQVTLTWQEGMGRLAPDDPLVERVMALAAPAPEAFPSASQETDGDLGTALNLMEEASTQGEALKSLLDGVQRFSERSALFVLKQGIASLYAHRGFEAENPRAGAPVVPPPELDGVVQGRTPGVSAHGPAYLALLGPLSRFEASDVRIVPLRLRRKVVALLMFDSGLRQVIDHPNHVRALAYAAEAKLSSLAGQKEDDRASTAEHQPSMPTQRIPEAIAESSAPALDPKVRQNAERSARVLVGDIELYFPAKVAQAQQQGNLYALLRDELDRSRASFVERYGDDLESQHQIFYHTVVQQLCGGEASRLGPAPWASR